MAGNPEFPSPLSGRAEDHRVPHSPKTLKDGSQSDAQRLFERFVTGIGHSYVIATSVEDVHRALVDRNAG
jgi:hypothetical protein